MLNKRLVGVIAVRDGWAVQSIGYRRYLPVGRAEVLAENLDRWGADEILLLCLDRTRRGLGPDLDLLRRVSERGLATPLTYAGGVHTLEEAAQVIQLGADRFCVDAALRDAPDQVVAMSALVGAQAIIASLPLSRREGVLQWLDYRTGAETPLTDTSVPSLIDGTVSEALVIDWRHEGLPGAFDAQLVEAWPWPHVPVIAFGGISTTTQVDNLLQRRGVVAAGVGNFLNYREHAIQHLKQGLTLSLVRERRCATEGSL